jgi:hypothetical protein
MGQPCGFQVTSPGVKTTDGKPASPRKTDDDGAGATMMTSTSCPSEPWGSELMAALNLSYPGLEAVARALNLRDNETACKELAKYYRTSNSSYQLRHPTLKKGDETYLSVANYRKDLYSFWGKTYKVGRLSTTGGLEWNCSGPPPGDWQWMLALNRHEWWPSVTAGYLEDWNRTRAAADMRFLDRTVVDWLSWSGHAPTTKSETSTGANHQKDWLTLDAGIRMGAWTTAFFVACGAPEFRDSTLLLMVSSIIDQNAFLVNCPRRPGAVKRP